MRSRILEVKCDSWSYLLVESDYMEIEKEVRGMKQGVTVSAK